MCFAPSHFGRARLSVNLRRHMNPAANHALKKLAGAIGFIAALVALIAVSSGETAFTVFFLLLLFLGLPVFILFGIEAGRTLRTVADVPTPWKAIGILLSLPQAIFGVVSVVLGLLLILWVAYNFLVERQPEFTGGVLPSLGLGPALLAAGWWWLRSAFRKEQTKVAPQSAAESDAFRSALAARTQNAFRRRR